MTDEDAPSDAPSPAQPGGQRRIDPRSAERMAAALRENLRRRKQQARARRSDGQAQPEEDHPPAKG